LSLGWAVNVTLPAFAAERRRLLSIDISIQQQTRRMPLLLSIDGTYRRTDKQTDGRTVGRSTVS